MPNSESSVRPNPSETTGWPGTFAHRLTLLTEHLDHALREYYRARHQHKRKQADAKTLQETADRLTDARDERQEFLDLHDSSGAWKRKEFGPTLAKSFRGHGFELADHETFEVRPEDDRAHVMLVNLGGLDRLNDRGGHSLGDLGLRRAVEKIEERVRAALVAADPKLTDETLGDHYTIYRASGNDFAVYFTDVDPAVVNELSEKILTGPLELRPGIDPCPLIANRISLGDIWRRLNALSPEERRAVSADRRPEKLAVTFLRQILDAESEMLKVEQRAFQMVESLRGPKSIEQRAAVERDYDRYQRPVLGFVFKHGEEKEALGFAAFRERIAELGAFDDPVSWQKALRDLAREHARRRLEEASTLASETERHIYDAVAREALGKTLSVRRAQRQRILGAGATEARPFEPPSDTQGKTLLRQLFTEYEQAEAGSREGRGSERTIHQKRRAWRKEWAKRDELTGLWERGPLFKNLEKALDEGKSVSLLYVDMAFLKYFDKQGGTELGNMALRKTAELLETVAAQFGGRGVELGCYRFGGDEFGISMVGGDEALLREVEAALLKAEAASGPIPPDAASSEAYFATALSYNFGSFHAKNKRELLRFLNKNAIPVGTDDPESRDNALADRIVELADQSLEINKAINRLELLTELGVSASSEEDRRRLEMLMTYSEKAIYGSEGKEFVETWVKQIRRAPENRVWRTRFYHAVGAFVLEQGSKKLEEKVSGMDAAARTEYLALAHATRFRHIENRIRAVSKELGLFVRMQESSPKRTRKQERKVAKVHEEERRKLEEMRRRLAA